MNQSTIEKLQDDLTKTLKVHLDKVLPNHPIANAYRYASLPPGKLFRPLLSAGVYLFHDGGPETYKNPKSSASLLASFLETHHSYTLVHDDMPCMDDDDVRRGKPSTHKVYGSWKALLIGDGLQAISWNLLSKIEHSDINEFFKYATWALGPKGLIQGQFLDLSREMNKSFDNLLLTHTYKTARLIQTSLVGGYFISQSRSLFKKKVAKNYHRLGESLGIVFQLLDDLTELTDEIGKHESSINPWLWNKSSSQKALSFHLNRTRELTPAGAHFLNEILKNYFAKILRTVNSNKPSIKQYLDENTLRPIESVLKIMSGL